MVCCFNTLSFCGIAIIVLTFTGYIAFRWMFTKKGTTRVIRGPFGFRVEVDEEYQGGKDGKKVFTKSWTCTCGRTVKPGETKCPSCGKSSDQAIRDADFEDIPADDT